jgi:hypothetical protein
MEVKHPGLIDALPEGRLFRRKGVDEINLEDRVMLARSWAAVLDSRKLLARIGDPQPLSSISSSPIRSH